MNEPHRIKKTKTLCAALKCRLALEDTAAAMRRMAAALAGFKDLCDKHEIRRCEEEN